MSETNLANFSFGHETQRNCSKVDGMPVDNGNAEQNFVGIRLYIWVGRDNKRRIGNGIFVLFT